MILYGSTSFLQIAVRNRAVNIGGVDLNTNLLETVMAMYIFPKISSYVHFFQYFSIRVRELDSSTIYSQLLDVGKGTTYSAFTRPFLVQCIKD